jgi:hypothetical protein
MFNLAQKLSLAMLLALKLLTALRVLSSSSLYLFQGSRS